MRQFPVPSVIFLILVVVVIGGGFVYWSSGADDGTSTPAPRAEAAAVTEAPAMPSATLADAVPVATETARVISTHPPAENEPELAPPTSTAPAPDSSLESINIPLPTAAGPTEIPSLSSTNVPTPTEVAPAQNAPMYSADVPLDTQMEIPAGTEGEEPEVPIVPIAPVREDNLGGYPGAQIPAGPVNSSELYVAHGDIYGMGQCFVHVFRAGDQVAGLAQSNWRLLRISGGAPEQREELVRQIQLDAASDPSAGGSCPFG